MLSMLSRLLKTAVRFVRTFAWVTASLAVVCAGLVEFDEPSVDGTLHP